MSFRDLFERGIAEFNHGRYYDCHESLEEIWQELRGEPRRFIQGIIHAAAALYHLERGNLRGVVSQLGKGIEKLGEYPSAYLGVDVAALVSQLKPMRDRVARSLADGSPVPVDLGRPTISYMPGAGALAALDPENDEHE